MFNGFNQKRSFPGDAGVLIRVRPVPFDQKFDGKLVSSYAGSIEATRLSVSIRVKVNAGASVLLTPSMRSLHLSESGRVKRRSTLTVVSRDGASDGQRSQGGKTRQCVEVAGGEDAQVRIHQRRQDLGADMP